MQPEGFDRLARAWVTPGSRRRILAALGLFAFGAGTESALARQKQSRSSMLDRRRKRAERRSQRKRRKKKGGKRGAFPRSCRRFVISAGPNLNDRFQHIDDDLLIELIPKGKNSTPTALLDDDNDSPNGPGGSHPKPPAFTARVGDRIRIVARNEVAGGCELDEIWLHCTEGRGGKIKLTDAITPEDCRPNAGTIGVFFETVVRISNT